MAAVKPYKIDVPQATLDKLQQKLSLTDLPDELDGCEWKYGVPLADVKRVVAHWQNGYDWRKHEAKLNELPHFQTPISVDGFGSLNIHFIHQRSSIENAVPLLFVHGWPGSFIEVIKILPGLAQGSSDFPAFHVVAPSLPNYGFSDGVKQKGFSQKQYAETCHKLMLALGYDKYVTQGGDWGSYITRHIAIHYPDHCLANHLNFAVPAVPSYKEPLIALRFLTSAVLGLSKEEKAGIERSKWFQNEGSGYFEEQTTRPQTLGYSLASSPVGLLAWIYEKLHDWTDSYPWTDDEILTWIMIYYVSTAGPAASTRIYYETKHDKTNPFDRVRRWVPKVKLGISRFPRELVLLPKSWHNTMGEFVFVSDHDRGGHFAAFEHPDAIVQDLRAMFGKKGPCAGIVKGASGYTVGESRL